MLVLSGAIHVARNLASLSFRRLHVLATLAAAVLATAAFAGCGNESTPPPPSGGTARLEEQPATATAAAPAAISTTVPPPGNPRAAGGGGEKPDPAGEPSERKAAPDSGPTDTFPTPPDRDFYRLAKELIPGVGDVNPVVRENAETLEVGHRRTLNLVDIESDVLYQSDFELTLVTPNAYWFVEDGADVNQELLERSASEFEDSIYPRVTAAFGTEWKPGVDGDPHLYVLNANLQGVGGYFSAADEYPKVMRPVSNEIEAIYINVRYLKPGTREYATVLAHELQHAVHWTSDRSEDTWINEGLSELAVTIAGYPQFSVVPFQRAGPTSLTVWPADDVGGAENYGAASLFMHYFTEHYASRDDLRPLMAVSEDSFDGIDSYLEGAGFDARFLDVFRDWAVANLLDEDTGRHGYSTLNVAFPVYGSLKAGDDRESTIPQYSNEYIRLDQADSPLRLTFEGETVTRLLPEDLGEGCWWSNRGDVIDSTLTATLDLEGVKEPSLDYQVWYSIEEDWDFAYVEVSVDGGQTWTILESPLTSSDDPLNVSFGPGYTGRSEGWQDESLDLRPWAGQEVMFRFQYITDASIHDHGLCVRDLRVSDGGVAVDGPVEWTPSGFAWTTNRVRQDFMVQVVFEGTENSANRVLQLELDDLNFGKISLEPDPSARRIVAIVQPVAQATRLPATYRLTLGAAE